MPIYMKFPGITGDVKAAGHQGWIELQSFQWGTARSNQRSGRGTNREAAAPKYSDAAVTKYQDKASVLLFRETTEGEGQDVVIDFMPEKGQNGQPPKPYMSLTLKGAMISNYQISGHGGGRDGKPMEGLTLSFAEIAYTYNQTAGDQSGTVWTYDLAPDP